MAHLNESLTLDQLLANNARWSEEWVAGETATGQAPKVLWIGCADSRVPETVITAARPGDIFTHRNIANQFPVNDDNSLAVLQHAVVGLGVSDIVIVGHTDCGGVQLAFNNAQAIAQGEAVENNPINRWVAPLAQLAKEELRLSTASEAEAIPLLLEANIQAAVNNVQEALINNNWDSSGVLVHGWLHDVATGRLSVSANPLK